MNLFGLEKSESQTLSRIHVAQGKAMNQATSCRLQVEGDRCAVPFSNKHRPLSHPTNRGRNPPFSQISIKTEASTRHQISIHNPQNHRWWVDLGIRWNYGKSSNIRHQPLGQATEVFSNSWGDGPIKQILFNSIAAMEFEEVSSWTLKADFCLAVTGVGSWQLMDWWPPFRFFFLHSALSY